MSRYPAAGNCCQKTRYPGGKTKTKTEARSTQISKTKHPNLAVHYKHETNVNTAEIKRDTGGDPGEVKWVNFHPPFSEPLFNHADAQTSNTSTRLWFYYIITKIHPPFQNPGSAPAITNRMQFKSTGRPGERLCFGRDQKTENAQTISRMLLYCQ